MKRSAAFLASLLVSVTCFCSFAEGAGESLPQKSVPEFCGEGSTAMPGKFLRWDCSGVVAETIDSLEGALAESHALSYSDQSGFKVYAPKQARPFSAWIFNGAKAVRYRAIFKDDIWQGIGVTTFCEESLQICERFADFSVSEIPRPLLFQLGPPPPEAPPVMR